MQLISKFLCFALIFTCVNAKDMYDDGTSNGSPNRTSGQRDYRNSSITLHDNIFRGRNVLSEVGRVSAITTEVDIYNIVTMKQQNFHQEQSVKAIHEFDLKAVNSGINLNNLELMIIENNQKKGKK